MRGNERPAFANHVHRRNRASDNDDGFLCKFILIIVAEHEIRGRISERRRGVVAQFERSVVQLSHVFYRRPLGSAGVVNNLYFQFAVIYFAGTAVYYRNGAVVVGIEKNVRYFQSLDFESIFGLEVALTYQPRYLTGFVVSIGYHAALPYYHGIGQRRFLAVFAVVVNVPVSEFGNVESGVLENFGSGNDLESDKAPGVNGYYQHVLLLEHGFAVFELQ